VRLGVALVLVVAAAGSARLGTAWSQGVESFACGAFKVESRKVGNASHWTIAGVGTTATETAVLRSGPRLTCLDGAVLAIEFVAASGQSFLDLYFPDGANIGYGGQHLVRNGRFVLPVQAKRRIEPRFQSAFDYHCRLEMPADPIKPESRKDCVL
jgi:hypothetical protein